MRKEGRKDRGEADGKRRKGREEARAKIVSSAEETCGNSKRSSRKWNGNAVTISGNGKRKPLKNQRVFRLSRNIFQSITLPEIDRVML